MSEVALATAPAIRLDRAETLIRDAMVQALNEDLPFADIMSAFEACVTDVIFYAGDKQKMIATAKAFGENLVAYFESLDEPTSGNHQIQAYLLGRGLEESSPIVIFKNLPGTASDICMKLSHAESVFEAMESFINTYKKGDIYILKYSLCADNESPLEISMDRRQVMCVINLLFPLLF